MIVPLLATVCIMTSYGTPVTVWPSPVHKKQLSDDSRFIFFVNESVNFIQKVKKSKERGLINKTINETNRLAIYQSMGYSNSEAANAYFKSLKESLAGLIEDYEELRDEENAKEYFQKAFCELKDRKITSMHALVPPNCFAIWFANIAACDLYLLFTNDYAGWGDCLIYAAAVYLACEAIQ